MNVYLPAATFADGRTILNSLSVTSIVCAAGAAPASAAPFASLSTPNTSTAVIIAAKSAMLTITKTLRPLGPGKSGRRRDARNDDVSANAMKIAPTVARPILFPVERAATSTGAISSDRQAARRRSTERRLQAQIAAATMASGLITISA